jgi:hypothetical protein
MTEVLERLVIDSGRWKKWILPGESSDDFSSIGAERRRWLIRTGARYIWQSPEAMAARWKLYGNMEENGIDAEHIVSSGIEKSMDKYYRAFNLIDLNNYL